MPRDAEVQTSGPVNNRFKILATTTLVCLVFTVFSLFVMADIRPSYSKVVCQRETYPGHWFLTGPVLIGTVLFGWLTFLEWWWSRGR